MQLHTFSLCSTHVILWLDVRICESLLEELCFPFPNTPAFLCQANETEISCCPCASCRYGPSHAGGLAKLKKSLKNEGSYSSSSLKGVVPPSNRLFAPGAQEEATMVTSEYKEKRKDRPLVRKKGAIMVSEGSDVQ